MEEKIMEFIKEKNDELKLGFDDLDLRTMTDFYYEILCERDLSYFDAEARNDKIFNEAYNKLKEEKKESKKAYSEDFQKELKQSMLDVRDMELIDREEKADGMIEVSRIVEKNMSSHGGYGYNEDYDDHGLDEESNDDSMKIKM